MKSTAIVTMALLFGLLPEVNPPTLTYSRKILLDAIADTMTMAGGLYHTGLQEVTESSYCVLRVTGGDHEIPSMHP